MEGYLFKRGTGSTLLVGRKNWKERWFMLKDKELKYYLYLDPETKLPVSEIDSFAIYGAEVIEKESDEGKYFFDIKQSNQKILHLYAESENSRVSWMIALRSASSNSAKKSSVFDELRMFDEAVGVESSSAGVHDDTGCEAPIEMEGYLTKKGSGSKRDSFIIGRRNWKKRWFVLRAGELKYYESYDAISEVAISEKGTFPIVGADVKSIGLDSKDLSFAICQGDRTLDVCADTELLRSVWLEALINAASGRRVISKCLSHRFGPILDVAEDCKNGSKRGVDEAQNTDAVREVTSTIALHIAAAHAGISEQYAEASGNITGHSCIVTNHDGPESGTSNVRQEDEKPSAFAQEFSRDDLATAAAPIEVASVAAALGFDNLADLDDLCGDSLI